MAVIKINVSLKDKMRFGNRYIVDEQVRESEYENLILDSGDEVVVSQYNVPPFNKMTLWGKVTYSKSGTAYFEVINYQTHKPTNKEEWLEHISVPPMSVSVDQHSWLDVISYSTGEDNLWHFIGTDERFDQFTGFSKVQRDAIRTSYQQDILGEELNRELADYGFSRDDFELIAREFGTDYNSIKENPFRLLTIGMSLSLCLFLAEQLDSKGEINNFREKYIFGCYYEILKKSEGNGHTYTAYATLLNSSLRLMDRIDTYTKEEKLEMDRVLSKAIKEGILVANKSNSGVLRIALKRTFEDELSIANEVIKRVETLDHDYEPIIRQVEAENPFEYAPQQRDAIEMVLKNRVSVITGGPGTGKTTVVSGAIKALRLNNSFHTFTLAAPSGKASQRLSESTEMNAQTIHSLLGMKPQELHATNEIDSNVLIVDEVSMMDVHICAELLKNTNRYARIIFVGDVDQLPSVDAGNVLHDLINSKVVPVVELTLVQRQKGVSSISYNASLIKKKLTDFMIDEKFTIENIASPIAAQDVLVQQYLDAVQMYGLKETIILTPVRKEGQGSVNELNPIIQEAYNPHGKGIRIGDTEFREGDRVMKRTNNMKGKNGDTGTIDRVNSVSLTVIFDNGQTEVFTRSQAKDDLELAYATTIHKSQGSEYQAVLMPIFRHHASLERDLIYTAVTRAKKQVNLVGDRLYLNGVVDETLRRPKTRKTLLKEMLQSNK